MVVIDAVGEFRRRAEMAVAHVKMAEPWHEDIIVDAVVTCLTFLEFVRARHLHDVHLVIVAPQTVDGVAVHGDTDHR